MEGSTLKNKKNKNKKDLTNKNFYGIKKKIFILKNENYIAANKKIKIF